MSTPVWQGVLGIAAALGIIGTLLRISFQLGSLVQEFRAYVKLNDLVVSEVKTRLDRLEHDGAETAGPSVIGRRVRLGHQWVPAVLPA